MLELKRFSAIRRAPWRAMANNPMFKGAAQMAEKMKEVQGFPLASTTTIAIMGKTTTTSREAVEVKQGPVRRLGLRAARGVQEGRSAGDEAPGRSELSERANALVSTAELAARLGEPGLRIVDVRWYLDPARKGREAYRAGHIPGAVFLDLDRDLAGPGGGRGQAKGRHPWPSEEQVGRVLGEAGIGSGRCGGRL